MNPRAVLIGKLLHDRGETLSVAESCTGGKLSSLLTEVSGASGWYLGAVTAYTRGTKQGLLGLTDADLRDGLISARCAEAMAKAIQRLTRSSWSLSVTGIAEGEGEGHEALYAWLGIVNPKGEVQSMELKEKDYGREVNIDIVANKLLEILREEMVCQ